MSVAAARASGMDIPETEKENDEVYICRLGPAVFHKWMPVWMFETAFEPVPEQRRGDRIRTLTEEMNRDPVELVITNASLRKDGKIFIMGYSYYTGEEYEQECDVESGMDILNFILSQKSFECHE